jgi:hypothetical protein
MRWGDPEEGWVRYTDKDVALRNARLHLADPEDGRAPSHFGVLLQGSGRHGAPEHEGSASCWCHPEIEHHPGGDLVIHRNVGVA